MKNGLAAGLIAVSLVLGAGGGVFGSYMYNKPIIEEFEGNVAQLQSTLDAIGPLTTLYTVKAVTKPGDTITQDMLQEQSVPASFVGSNALNSTVDIIGKYSKVSISPGTTLTSDLLMDDDINDEKELWHTVRWYDVVVSMWPTAGLDVGKYVDLRMLMPYGEEYIVLSHMRIDGISDGTVRFKMTQSQIYLYQSALVDYYLNSGQGVILYFTEYLEPGVQKPAQITYKISEEIANAMRTDPNLYNTAWKAIYNADDRAAIEGDLVPTDDELAKKPEQVLGEINSGRNQWSSVINGSSSSYRDEESDDDGGKDDDGGIVW